MATVTLQQIKGSPLTNTEFETNLTNINAETVDNSGLYKLRPSLDVDLVGTKSVSPLMGFSRGSTGTYYDQNGILKTASINEPRFDYDPITGELKGLLIEDSRTNLLTYSEQFDNAAWVKTQCTVIANNTIAPDITSNADKILSSATTNVMRIGQSVTPGTGTFTISCAMKASEWTYSAIVIYDGISYVGVVYIDLSTGSTLTKGTSAGTSSIFALGNGWYKVTLTATCAGSYSGAFSGFRMYSSNPTDYNTSAIGDGTSGIYIWGAQLEQGSTPTSYIPTTTTNVTRSADTLTINKNTNWFNSVNGTLALSHDAVSGQPILGEGSNTLLTSLGAGITNIDYSNSQLAVVTQTGQTTNTQGIFNFDTDLYVLGNSTSKANAHVKYLKFYPNNVIGSTPSGSGFILDDGYALLQEDNSVIFQE